MKEQEPPWLAIGPERTAALTDTAWLRGNAWVLLERTVAHSGRRYAELRMVRS